MKYLTGNHDNLVDYLATDPIAQLPIYLTCEAIKTPDLATPVHYRLLDTGERADLNNLEQIRKFMQTVKLLHKNGFKGVRFGIQDGNWSNGWLPLVDLNSPEGNVFASSFSRYTLGRDPYTPDECLAAVIALYGAE